MTDALGGQVDLFGRATFVLILTVELWDRSHSLVCFELSLSQLLLFYHKLEVVLCGGNSTLDLAR